MRGHVSRRILRIIFAGILGTTLVSPAAQVVAVDPADESPDRSTVPKSFSA